MGTLGDVTDFAATFRRDSLAAQLGPRLGRAQLLAGADPNVLVAAVGRSAVPSGELIDVVLDSGAVEAVRALAEHPRTPSSALTRLAADRRIGVVDALLQRPELPVEAALLLAGRPDGQAAVSLAVRGELPLWARLRVARGLPLAGRRSAARPRQLPALRHPDFAAALGLTLLGGGAGVLDELLKAAGGELTVLDWQVAVHAALAGPDPAAALTALGRPLHPVEPVTVTATTALGVDLVLAMRRPEPAAMLVVAAAWAAQNPVPVWAALAALPDDPAAPVAWPAELTGQLTGAPDPLPLTVAVIAAHLPGTDQGTVALRRAALCRLPGLGRGLATLGAADALAVLVDPRLRSRPSGVWADPCRAMVAATRPDPVLLAAVPVRALADLLVIGTAPHSDVAADLVSAAFAAALGSDDDVWAMAWRLLADGFPGTLTDLVEVCAGVSAGGS